MRKNMWTAALARKALLAIALMLAPLGAYAASILPEGQTQFLDDNGNPLSAGTIDFYVPSTTTRKDTWQNAAESILNTNPVTLDAAGRAIIYGTGSYRMIVKDADGNTIYDAVTAGDGGDGGSSAVIWGGVSGGAANAQTITAADFTGADGQVIAFIAGLTNTGALTIDPANFAATSIRKDLPGGPVALVGGEVRAGNLIMAVYDSSAGYFHLVNQPDPFGGQPIVGLTAGATTDVLGSNGTVVNIVGTGATITSLGSRPNQFKIGYFTAANTITADPTTLITPGGANISAAAGDAFGVVSDATGNARIVWYQGQSVDPFDPAIDNLFTAAQSITISGTGPVLNGVSTDAGAVAGPNVDLYRNSASPLANDAIGAVTFRGKDSGGNATTYATVGSAITDPTDSSEDALFSISLVEAGATITPVTVAGTTANLNSADAGAGVGPILAINRNSASPAASDVIGGVYWNGIDSGAAPQSYGVIFGTITDPTAASEDGTLTAQTPVAGTLASRMVIGAGVYHPSASGADKGNNTLNFGTIYQNNQQVYSAGGTDVAVADGGTGASTAANARANLGTKNAADSSFRANKGASNQVIGASASPTKVTFGTEAFDTGGNFASSTWTPPAGRIMVETCLTGISGGIDGIVIYKNGSAVQGAGVASAALPVMCSMLIDSANGTDTYDVYIYSSGGVTIDAEPTFAAGLPISWFQGSMIGGP